MKRLLLIDEPGSLDPVIAGGFGPAAAQVLCGSTNSLPNSSIGAGVGSTNCPEFVEISNGVNVMTNGTTAPYTAGANVFSGVWGGSSAAQPGYVLWNSDHAPDECGFRTRYTASPTFASMPMDWSGGTLAGTNQVYAYISISGPTSVPTQHPEPDRRLHTGRSEHQCPQAGQQRRPIRAKQRKPVQQHVRHAGRDALGLAVQRELRQRV